MKNGKLGLGSAIAVCIGMIVATSCLISLCQGFGMAGNGFILPMAIVLVLNWFMAMSFSELHYIMPNLNGGTGQYVLAGLGPVPSIIANISTYVFALIFASSIELAMSGMVLHEFIPQIPAVAISVIALVLMTIFNLFGIDVFAKIQNLTVTLLLGALVAMGFLSFFKLGTGEVISAAASTTPSVVGIGGILGLSAVAFWLFMGCEFVIPISKDLKNPRRDVLLSMILGLAILFVVQSMLGMGILNYVAMDELLEADLPHMVFAEKLLGSYGKVLMGIVTFLASISTLNTILPSTAKILQGMAAEGMVPKLFGKVNRYNIPFFGMFVVVIADALIILTGYVNTNGITMLLLAASCFWITSYILIHATVLILRKKYPDAPRRKRLVLWGIPQVLGILGNAYMIWNISSDPVERLNIYKIFFCLFLLLVTYAIVWVKLIMHRKMFRSATLKEITAE